MAILLLVEHEKNQMHASTQQLLQAAVALNLPITALVVGYECRAVAEQASLLRGVQNVLWADNVCYQHQLPENISQLIVSVADGYTHILAASTSFGKSTLPRVAAKLDVPQVSDVMQVVSPDTFEHPIYAGNAIETVRVLASQKVLTVRTIAFEAIRDTQAPCTIERVDTVFVASQTQWVGREVTQSVRPELTEAMRVVSGGRGLQSAENFKIIENLADVLGAAVGASRAAVDAGFISNDHQVGQTGKMVSPSLYIAIGISGAIQHLAGMNRSKVIVAINKDENAPIVNIATYALIGDLFTVVPELIEQLKGV